MQISSRYIRSSKSQEPNYDLLFELIIVVLFITIVTLKKCLKLSRVRRKVSQDFKPNNPLDM